MSIIYSDRERQFEEYLRDGISAAKSGQSKLAQSLLDRALYLNPNDARPYIWLSSTTDNPDEQLEYLEKAVAIDPGNAAARRGLALLKTRLNPGKLLPEGIVMLGAITFMLVLLLVMAYWRLTQAGR